MGKRKRETKSIDKLENQSIKGVTARIRLRDMILNDPASIEGKNKGELAKELGIGVQALHNNYKAIEAEQLAAFTTESQRSLSLNVSNEQVAERKRTVDTLLKVKHQVEEELAAVEEITSDMRELAKKVLKLDDNELEQQDVTKLTSILKAMYDNQKYRRQLLTEYKPVVDMYEARVDISHHDKAKEAAAKIAGAKEGERIADELLKQNDRDEKQTQGFNL